MRCRAAAPFDLDHAGAEVGEQQGGVRTRDGRGQVEHPHTFEQTDAIRAGSILVRQLIHRQHASGVLRVGYPQLT